MDAIILVLWLQMRFSVTLKLWGNIVVNGFLIFIENLSL